MASFKVFLAYKGVFGVTDEELYKTLELAKKLGVITTAHCENADLVLELQKKLLAEGKTGPEYHYWSRPPVVEAEGVHHLMTFAEMTGAHVYTVHTSCEESVREALVGAQPGVNVWIETLIQYLLLDRTDAEKPKFEGAKNVMSPPLRDKSNQPFLWNGLRQGLIATLATDHAPFDFDAQKRMGEGDFTKIPNGIPSLENRVDLYFTHGVKRGRIDLQQFVATASTNAAKIFGLFPAKRCNRTRQRCRSRCLRSELSRHDFSQDGSYEPSTTTPSREWKSKAAPMSSPCAAKSPHAMASSAVANSSGATRRTSRHSERSRGIPRQHQGSSCRGPRPRFAPLREDRRRFRRFRAP